MALMLRLRRKLLTGKGMSSLAFLAAILLCISLLLSDTGLASKLLGSIAIFCILAVTVLVIADLKKIRGMLKAHDLASPRSSTPYYAPTGTRKSPEKASSTEPQELNYFAPGRISGSAILDKPQSHVAGRQAAEQTMAGNPDLKYFEVLRSTAKRNRPVVLYLGNPSDEVSLLCEVRTLYRGLPYQEFDVDVSFFVVDLCSAENGLWSGITDAACTVETLALLEQMRKAKSQGIIVIARQGERKSHFTSSIMTLADLVIEDGEIRNFSHTEVPIGVIQQLAMETLK